MSEEFRITTFYKFISVPEERISELRSIILEYGQKHGIMGLILIGPEGCNATVAARQPELEAFKQFLQEQPQIGTLTFKDSNSPFMPFRRFKVEVRKEIVNIQNPEILPEKTKNNHLSPSEWNQVLQSEHDVMVVDTRNFYETEVGVFEDAVDLNLSKFSEFPEKFEELEVPKDRKVLMYCTGGIRCEKAIVELQKRGYKECYQLEGGILKYLEEFPNSLFKGECFVFDHRVAVNQNLEPSQRYTFCPHCGNPADNPIECGNCGKAGTVCNSCKSLPGRISCSKNCAHHVRRAQIKDGATFAL